jgi:lactate dehydrogenase-like 2-hydroxyacid dehydrogenase
MSQHAPTVMISSQRMVPMLGRLEDQGWRVVHAWDLSDADRQAVRACIGAGDDVMKPEFLATLPNLTLVACVSAGYDGVDVDWCRARGIEVTHAKGVNADDVADHAVGLMIAGWRNIALGDRNVRAGLWREGTGAHPSLKGRKVGVVGLGHIGAAIAERCTAFGMEVNWWGPRPKPEAKWPRAGSLPALAEWCDILMVASAANAENRHMIDRAVIEAVGPRGMIVNVGRGSLIDEDALIAALKDKRLGRAGLDVFEEEPTPAERWADVPGTVLTPHMGGGTVESLPAMVAQAIENVRRHFAGEPLLSPV